MTPKRLLVSAGLLVALVSPPLHAQAPTAAASSTRSTDATSATALSDPLSSPRWEDMRQTFFPGAEVVFDERVRVSAPSTAEDALNVPVAVDLRKLPAVEEVIVFADFNPIVRALSYEPGYGQSGLAFRLKLQQSTPVRAAARTAEDGLDRALLGLRFALNLGSHRLGTLEHLRARRVPGLHFGHDPV